MTRVSLKTSSKWSPLISGTMRPTERHSLILAASNVKMRVALIKDVHHKILAEGLLERPFREPVHRPQETMITNLAFPAKTCFTASPVLDARCTGGHISGAVAKILQKSLVSTPVVLQLPHLELRNGGGSGAE